MINKCRVCGGLFFDEPIMKFKNAPIGAQYLPTKRDIDEERPDEGVNFDVCQCSICGLVQLNCEPTAYYQDSIRSDKFSDALIKFREKQFKDIFSLSNKVLEIGCGKGEYLSILQRCVPRAYGIEASYRATASCYEKGLDVAIGYISDPNIKLYNYPFDSFAMFNFLEHFPDPNSCLQALYKNTTDRAIGLIEVPNFDMILQQGLFAEFIRDHLLYFTISTLEHTLNRNGWDILDFSILEHNYIISAIVTKKRPDKISGTRFKAQQTKVINDIQTYIDNTNGVSIYGASHQCFTILSMLKDTSKIKCVIDDAPFKQKKYTPYLHIPIYSPDEVLNPTTSIIVIGGSYSDEIVRKIKQYSFKYHIAILRPSGLEIVQ